MSEPQRTHRVSAREHARKRFYERYGVWMTRGTYRELCDEIAAGAVPALANGRKRGTIHMVKVFNYAVPAVWNPELQCIVTFLQPRPVELQVSA